MKIPLSSKILKVIKRHIIELIRRYALIISLKSKFYLPDKLSIEEKEKTRDQYVLMQKKQHNILLAAEDLIKKRSLLCCMPTMYNLILESRCNLKCIMCINRRLDQQSLNDLNKQQLDIGLLEKIAKEGFPYAEWVQLTTAGEPLLSEHFEYYIKLAEKYKVKVDMITNGTLLKRLRGWMLNTIKQITISLDAAEKETYEKIRIGANFDEVLENIKYLNKLREKLNTKDKPKLILAFVLMRRNIEELPHFIELASKLKAGVSTAHAVIFKKELFEESLINHKEIYNKFIIKAQKIAEKLNVNFGYPPPFNDLPQANKNSIREEMRDDIKQCTFLWNRFYVWSNGDVVPCCSPEPVIVGNVKKQPIREIWNNQIYQEMRKRLIRGNPLSCCAKCPFYSSQEKLERVLIKY